MKKHFEKGKQLQIEDLIHNDRDSSFALDRNYVDRKLHDNITRRVLLTASFDPLNHST